MTGCRVLSLRPFEQPARDGRRTRLRRASLERLHVSEPERLEVGEIEAADRTRDVAQRVRSLVAVVARVRECSGADGVEDDHARSWHGAILWRSVTNVLGVIGILAFCACVITLAAGVTWIVVKVSPTRTTTGPSTKAD
jgi:hypothetical protein